MRPNIDVPWSTHGKIKEYGERTGQSIEEAYLDIIERGLQNTADRSARFDLDAPGEVEFSPFSEELGVGTVVLYSDFSPTAYSDPTIIRATERNVSIADMEGILATLARLFNLSHDGSFAIHQQNGGWYGDGGLDEFAYWLDNLTELERQAEAEIDSHRTASAAFLTDAAPPVKHVLVYATPSKNGTVEKFGIEFLIDGYPFEGGTFRDFADQVGISLRHAATWPSRADPEDRDVTEITEPAEGVEREDIDVDGPVVLERKRYESPVGESIRGVVCENPFYGAEELAAEVFSHRGRTALPEVRHLFGPLKNSVDENMRYELFVTRFDVTDLEYVTEAPFNLLTIGFEANW